jgi:lipid II:glycine glycyltransferase (peptidoglycan interpeptide bridge formation enzyme)
MISAHTAIQPALAVIEPDPDRWDTFVDQHAQGNLLQQANWGRLKAEFGWQFRRVAIVDQQDQVVAGAQILLRSRYGLSVAYAPRGPLFAGDPAIDTLLLKALRRLAWRRRAVFLRLEPNLSEADSTADRLHTWLLLQGLQVAPTIQPRSSIHVDLFHDDAGLLAACSKGHRADIRKAQRNQVTIRVGEATDIAAFYAILQATAERADFGIHSEHYYRRAWELFQPRSRLLLAEQEGAVVAGHLVFADSHYGLYLYSGAQPAGLKSGANHLLEWEALRWARDQGCTGYDLWGIPDSLGRAAAAEPALRSVLETAAKDDPLIGVYRFKKGFGGRIVRYLPAYDQVLMAPLYGMARKRIG